jgi:23S rRNA (cytosine1962-C5)-methyltransferase
MPFRIEISKKARDFVRAGHLWVFSNEVRGNLKDFKKGEWGEFYSRDDFVGAGYINPHSLIAGRVCSPNPIQDRFGFFRSSFEKAYKKRQDLGLMENSGWSIRLVHSEGDGLPGLIVDIFKNTKNKKTTLVALSNTAGMDEALDDWSKALLEIFKPDEFIIRAESSVRHLESVTNYKKILLGESESLQSGIVQEGDVLFAADFLNGQKSGFFIDQRDNRDFLKSTVKRLKSLEPSRPVRVLDLCSYSGGWGLSALKAGADTVTFVDQSADALNLVKDGLALNGFSKDRAELVCEDVFDFLKKSNQIFQIVVCDPPAFVKSKKKLSAAERAYFNLNSLAVSRAERIFISCSCSYHLDESTYRQILQEALKQTGRVGRVLHRGGQGLDHPWILNIPETNYLKTLAVDLSI